MLDNVGNNSKKSCMKNALLKHIDVDTHRKRFGHKFAYEEMLVRQVVRFQAILHSCSVGHQHRAHEHWQRKQLVWPRAERPASGAQPIVVRVQTVWGAQQSDQLLFVRCAVDRRQFGAELLAFPFGRRPRELCGDGGKICHHISFKNRSHQID